MLFFNALHKKGLAYERQTLFWKDCFKLEQISAEEVAPAKRMYTIAEAELKARCSL